MTKSTAMICAVSTRKTVEFMRLGRNGVDHSAMISASWSTQAAPSEPL